MRRCVKSSPRQDPRVASKPMQTIGGVTNQCTPPQPPNCSQAFEPYYERWMQNSRSFSDIFPKQGMIFGRSKPTEPIPHLMLITINRLKMVRDPHIST